MGEFMKKKYNINTRDQLRNLNDIQMTNINDLEVKINIESKVRKIQCTLNSLYEETGDRLKIVAT